MALEDIETASAAELRSRVKQCFAESAGHQATDSSITVPLILNAQLYLQELDRRHASRIAVRDLILEMVVILLIGWEIRLGYDEGMLMNQQNAILANLAHSTADTAQTMKALALTSETMNAALHEQLDLSYAVSLDVNFNGGMELINVQNNGPTDVTIWGDKVGSEAAVFERSGRLLARGGKYTIAVDKLFRDAEAKAYNSKQRVTVPLQIFLRNINKRKYIARCEFVADYSSNRMQIYAGLVAIFPFDWIGKEH